jgi:hypothetical protein
VSDSEFRQIAASVLLRREGASGSSVPLYMFGDMPFLFVKLPSGHFSHILPDNMVSNAAKWRWEHMWVSDEYRLVLNTTVITVVDIAAATRKRLGVKAS